MVAHNIQADFPNTYSFKTRIYGASAAFVFTILAVSQLLGFEKMREIFASFWPNELGWVVLPLASVIVICEVFAIPFLLGMRLSKLMRGVSFVCTMLVIVFLVLSSIQAFIVQDLNSGVFGSYVTAADGVILSIFSLVVIWIVAQYTVRSVHASSTS